jgi:hypothetical protein
MLHSPKKSKTFIWSLPKTLHGKGNWLAVKQKFFMQKHAIGRQTNALMDYAGV